jgi:hypothetical protein
MNMRIARIEYVTVKTYINLPAGDESFRDDAEFADWLNENPELADESTDWRDYARFDTDFDAIAIYTSVPRQTSQVEALAAYFLEGRFAGEIYGVMSPDSVNGWGQVFIIRSDSTKSRHDDWTEYMDELWPLLREGSPIRKTNVKGPGTKGTRAVEGLRCDLWVAFR